MVHFFLLYMQMDRKIIAVIAVSVSPETYGLGESGDRRKSQWKCTLIWSFGQGHSPSLCLGFLKGWKASFTYFSYWEDEWDNASEAPKTGQKKKRGASRMPSCTIIIELCLLLGWVTCCKALETIPSVMKDPGSKEQAQCSWLVPREVLLAVNPSFVQRTRGVRVSRH